MKKLLFGSVLFFCSSLYAGTKLLAPTNAPHSDTLPATCSQGDIYQLTSAGTGTQWYACESANTWVQQGGSSSGSFIKNQSTLQSGATAYPDFIYAGSSASIPSLAVTGSAPSGVNADVSIIGAYSTGNNAIKIKNTSTFFSGNKASIIWTGPKSGADGTETLWSRIKPGLSLMDFGASASAGSGDYSALRIDQTVTDPVFYFGNIPGAGDAARNVPFCFGGFAPYTAGNPCFEYDQPNNDFKFYQDIHAAYGTLAADQGIKTSTLTITGLPGAGTLYADASGNVSTTTVSSSSGGGYNIEPATVTASFPLGVSVSTITGTDNWHTTGSILADGTVGSDSGNYNIHTETITISSPTADGSDYLLTVKNGVGSWSKVVSDPARTGTYNLFTASNVFSGGLNIASATATNPTFTNTGDFSIDTSSGQVVISTNGSSGIAILQYWIPNSIVIATPTVGDYHFFDKAWFEVSIDTVVCVSSAATSATIQLFECDKNGSNCTSMGSATACGTTETTLALTDTDLAYEDRIRVMVTATSGTPGEVAIDLKGHEVRH